jgi:hypothetical protein
MANEDKVLLVVQILNALIGLSKELNLRLGPLAARLDDGTDLTVEELRSYVSGLREELDGLEADVEARKAGPLIP